MVDHRLSGIITSIKNQGNCLTSWAFATSAFIESYLIKYYNFDPNIDISEQHLVECTKRTCSSGGNMQ